MNPTVPETARVIIVGAGQAGGELAAALRIGGHVGSITLFGDEPDFPYTRPPLSKAYLLGTVDRHELLVRAESMYADQHIDVRRDTRVTSVDRDRRVISTSSGDECEYDVLVFATGGRPRRLPDPGLDEARNVFYVRTIADVDLMRSRFVSGARLLVIGGGYIGLEIGSVARRLGLNVLVVEAQDRILARVAAPATSAFFERLHTEEGVEILTGAGVSDYLFDASGDVSGARLTDGSRIDCDLMLVGIGLIPNVELAQASGLETDNGIVVSSELRTSDPAVWAIGDVARHPSPDGTLRRIESMPNASEQARVVAESILGRPQPYGAIPWFWSDQYDVKLQVAGMSGSHDSTVVRGNSNAGRSMTVFYLSDGAIIAADVASNPREFAIAKKLVAAHAVVDPGRLSDESIPLKQILSEALAVEIDAPIARSSIA